MSDDAKVWPETLWDPPADEAKRPAPPAELWALWSDEDYPYGGWSLGFNGEILTFADRETAEASDAADGARSVLIGVSPARLAEAERERDGLRAELDRLRMVPGNGGRKGGGE